MDNSIDNLKEQYQNILKKGRKKILLLLFLWFSFLGLCFLFYSLKDHLFFNISLITLILFSLYLFSSMGNLEKDLNDNLANLRKCLDIKDRTCLGILELDNGNKIKSVFLKPLFDDDPYCDITNNIIYERKNIVGFQFLGKI